MDVSEHQSQNVVANGVRKERMRRRLEPNPIEDSYPAEVSPSKPREEDGAEDDAVGARSEVAAVAAPNKGGGGVPSWRPPMSIISWQYVAHVCLWSVFWANFFYCMAATESFGVMVYESENKTREYFRDPEGVGLNSVGRRTLAMVATIAFGFGAMLSGAVITYNRNTYPDTERKVVLRFLWLWLTWNLVEVILIVFGIAFQTSVKRFDHSSLYLLLIIIPLSLTWPRFLEVMHLPNPVIRWKCGRPKAKAQDESMA